MIAFGINCLLLFCLLGGIINLIKWNSLSSRYYDFRIHKWKRYNRVCSKKHASLVRKIKMLEILLSFVLAFTIIFNFILFIGGVFQW